jgi:hypothetical protein
MDYYQVIQLYSEHDEVYEVTAKSQDCTGTRSTGLQLLVLVLQYSVAMHVIWYSNP